MPPPPESPAHGPSPSDVGPYVVPDEAVYFLLLQRSRYRWQPLYRLFSLFGAGDLYKQRVTRSFIEKRRAPAIGRRYRRDIEATLDQVAPHLPARIVSAVDVGGGIGGLCLGLWRRYAETLERLHLLDRSEVTPTYYTGFRDEAAFYNSLEVARDFLRLNGVPERVTRIVDAAKDPFPEGPHDLVISTLAWGFHFPVSTYVDEVRRTLAPDGALILHVRRDTDGEAVLEANFRSVRRIDENRRSHLVVARDPIGEDAGPIRGGEAGVGGDEGGGGPGT